ncbi:hypothetical protein BT96DRAFT_381432 [Gymnopus androsaceus JB14]|uniref:PUB domain-containing protein n=1 Tax=Gymnopus androsaceus JB14 TaxID=1447944 RepID=A0A6A4IJ40_9AGAR|nr:hypothetical protein BT96DRAFT_381432 [Gymnopus androsaceus JB14]
MTDRASLLAEAVERRISAQEPLGLTPAQMAAEHEQRQRFRRLIDPGILRPNPEAQAVESLKILFKLSENLIQEPENPKFQRFKTTNAQIQKHIISPKGTVEYLRELGFHPEVVDFQPFFVFNPKFLSDLKIGNAMLKESLDLQDEKKARAMVVKQTVQQARAEVVQKVQLAFMEDRRAKMEADERERELREARAAIAARKAAQQSESTESGNDVVAEDDDGAEEHTNVVGSAPPPYDDDQ